MTLKQRLNKFSQYVPTPWLVALVLAIGYFAFSLRPKPELVIHDTSASRFPQFYMKDIKTREFDPQGKLHFQLETPLATHYQVNPEGPTLDDYTLIARPNMAFYDAESNAPWLVSAETGRSEANGNLLRLLDNILIQQQTPTQGLIQITTSELLVRAREQFAETDKAVKMRSAKGQIDAIGMDADLAQSRLQLKSQVKAVYDPR